MDIGGPASTAFQQILLKLRYRVLSKKIIYLIMIERNTEYLLRSKKFFYAKSSPTIRLLKHSHFPSNLFRVLFIACFKA